MDEEKYLLHALEDAENNRTYVEAKTLSWEQKMFEEGSVY